MGKPLNKTVVNLWLDALLLVTFLTLCWVAIVVRYVFPSPERTNGWTLWGLNYLAWTDVQFAVHCVLVAEILLHVMLHWPWVCGVVTSWRRKRAPATARAKPGDRQDAGSRTLWGVGLLIAVCNVVGLAVAAAVLSVNGPTP